MSKYFRLLQLPEYLIERSNYYEQIFLSGEGDRIPGTGY